MCWVIAECLKCCANGFWCLGHHDNLKGVLWAWFYVHYISATNHCSDFLFTLCLISSVLQVVIFWSLVNGFGLKDLILKWWLVLECCHVFYDVVSISVGGCLSWKAVHLEWLHSSSGYVVRIVLPVFPIGGNIFKKLLVIKAELCQWCIL